MPRFLYWGQGGDMEERDNTFMYLYVKMTNVIQHSLTILSLLH